MITYLSGASNPDLVASAPAYVTLGILAQPGNRLDRRAGEFGGRMAFDNGCFTKGASFDLEAYLRRLAEAVAEGNVPLWATAPDVVGDYAATSARSFPVLERIRELGVPAAYVAQNGMEDDLEGFEWDRIDVLFLGGDDAFKLGPAGAACVAAAKAHGKRVHMGRVNSLKRLRYADAIGCDTADGTYLARAGRQGTSKVLGWLDQLAAEWTLELELAA